MFCKMVCLEINDCFLKESVLLFYFLFLFAEIVDKNEDNDFSMVLHKLVSLNIEGLPPGGGLAAK